MADKKPWEMFAAPEERGPWSQFATPVVVEAPKDKGFFSNLGSLIYEGGERAIGAAKIAPSVVTGDVGADKAKLLAQELSRPESVRPKELVEAQGAFKDEAAAFEKAKGFTESIGPVADMLLEFGKQVITNPKGAIYLSAQSAANMAPQIAGMIAGGKGGALAGSLAGPGGAAVGAGVGAIGGGFAAGAPMEVGSEFIGRIGDILRERKLEPTEENIASILRDKKTIEQAVNEARTKGVTTAAVDSLMTVGAGKFAAAPRRAAIEAAKKELGAAADAAKLAARADDILKARTIGQKVGRGAGAVGIETAGGGISEAAGQAAAYGKVNLEDVGQEMLGELGGSAIEVPSAAYATATDAFKKPKAETPPAPAPVAKDVEKPTPPVLALGSEGVFTPVALPDGSVAMTREELNQYEQDQFRKKYEPQKVEQPPTPEPYVKQPSISGTKPEALLGEQKDALAGEVSARRSSAEPQGDVPLADDYAFLQREKQRLLQQDQTPDTKKLIGRIDERISEVLKRDIERQRADAEAAKTSVFGQKELPPVESRDVVIGGEELAKLQAREAAPEASLTKKEITGIEKMRGQPAPPESDADRKIAELEKERNKIKSTNLYGELIGKLAPGDVSDISPDIGKNLRVKGGRGGAMLSDIVSSGTLDNYLPPDKRPGSITFDEQEATEYIKDKLRNQNHLTFDAEVQARQLDDQIEQLRKEVEAPRMAEYEISEVEPGEAASVERTAGDQAVSEAVGDIRYQRSTTGGKSIGKQQTQSVVDVVKSQWANAPEVVVADNMDDPAIPEAVRAHNKEAIAKGAKGSPKGFFYKGKAYVLADAATSPTQVMETLFHESLGHYGLRGTFGPEMGKVLADVVKNRKADVEAKAEQYGLDPKNPDDMLEAAEEVLAEMAQTKPGLSFVKRAISVIRNFLRDLGLPFKMSNEDIIQKYILPARAFVESGKGRAVEGKPAAMREPAKTSSTEEVRYQREAKPTPNQAGQENLAILDATGMQLQPPEPGRIQKIKDTLKSAGEDPALTKESAKSAVKKFLDKMEVAAFSGDAAFNNDIRRNLEADFAEHPEILGKLLEASQSQAVHSDAVATRFIVDGGVAYDNETKKWIAIKKEDNFIKLAKQIEDAAKKYGLTKEQTEQISHTYFVAKRFKDLLKKQRARDAEMDRLQGELDQENANIKQYKKDGDFEKLRTSERAKNDIRADIAKLEKAKVFISEDQRAMIEPGMSLVKNMPELEDISETWQGIRANAVKAMIDGGLWSREFAESMLDEAAYVPFYRDEQLDEGKGPQEFIKGLEVKGKEYRLKGSNAAVNDIFDNMVRWTQYAINRSIRNHKALQMVDIGTELQMGDRKMAEKVKEMDPKKNTIRVFRDGTQEIYSMADPLYVDAFSAISNVTIPSLKFFTWFSNLLRQSVVLYPLFSVAQVPQDAFSAMFSSGLKTQYALRIPVLAVKEFLKTINKTSATHKLLESYGATGVRDFNATVARNDIQIAAGLRGAKGVIGKGSEFLSHVAMAADNSIRQAVYEASMQQGLSKKEAVEKAFDIINFRRRGTSKLVNLAGQTVPFFYAYMSVQRTAYKTLTGVGISPQQRKDALSTLASTSGAVMALSLLYVMMNGGDEEYEKTPDAVRDRTLNIPGTGGLRIPLRPDLFLMPKVLTEHLYHLITDDGLSDGAKFRKSVADGVANAVLSPQPIPQAVKPAIEVAINYDFFQGRPLIGQFEKQKEAERQFNDNTSEFSKMLGQFGVSPIAADHMIRGMFGSAGGLFLYATNFMINSDPDVPRPELSFRDAMSAAPGTSGFVTKASENALKTDFYALRDEVEKVKNTYNDIKLRSPQELEQFLSDEKNIARLGLAKGTEKIGMQLSKIRRAINQITNAPEDLYSASEKKDAIKELRDVEREMLKSIDIPAMRKMAMM